MDQVVTCERIREGKFSNYVMCGDSGGGLYLVDVVEVKCKKKY